MNASTSPSVTATAAESSPVRVALVTNIPAPYRLPVYELLAKAQHIDLKIYFCSGREPDRLWDLNALTVPHQFLGERFVSLRSRFIHVNPDVWPALAAQRPHVLVTTGFNPTHLLAFAYAALHGCHHIPMTDGTPDSEAKLSALHRWVRRRIYARSSAFIGASNGSMALYRQYGVSDALMFKSHLCADNETFTQVARLPAEFDFIFCGRFAVGKQPLFALAVAAATARRLGRKLRILLVGAGELEGLLREEAQRLAPSVEASFAGFSLQRDLPAHYARAGLMLFPTLNDTWGVVANEACAAGLPVITSSQAGVAGELVRDGENGAVLPLEVEAWAEVSATILSTPEIWQRMSERSRQLVGSYTYANAARGLADAVQHAIGRASRAGS